MAFSVLGARTDSSEPASALWRANQKAIPTG